MLKRNIYILVLNALLVVPGISFAQCYELIWSDEFDYNGFPDPSKWTFETGGGGWGNNELQYYKANDEDNSWVDNGMLSITALKENFGGRSYTSARMNTKNKFSVQYGKIEARMKLPYGQGIWPAFWAMGDNFDVVGWPRCGEIDIMEFVGGPTRNNQVHGTVHWDNNGSHAQHGGSYRLPSGIFADDFHTFSVVWTPQYIRWYVDGNQFHAIDIRPAGLSEFHQKFFIILNLAVGGNWPGAPDASTIFPQTLEVDYIRVYKNTADIQEIPVAGDAKLPPKASLRQFSLPSVPDWTYQWTVPDDAVIELGQGSEMITVTWGCNDGEVTCTVTGECGTYELSKSVGVQTEIYGPMFVAQDQANVLFYTDSLAETTFKWVFPSDVSIMGGQGTDSVYVNWGNTFEDVVLITESDCGISETSYPVVKAGQYPFPDILQPNVIPGTIEAVNFDYGGPGVAYYDTTTGNTGPGPRQDTHVDTEYNDGGAPNVGWITNGEWLEYTIKVETDTFYAVDMRVATNNASGGPFSVLFNDEVRISGVRVANTGGWATFTTNRIGTVYLTQSDTLMRIFFNTGGFNFSKVTFTPTSDPTSVASNQADITLEVYPLPAKGYVTVRSDTPIEEVQLIDLNGRKVLVQNGFQERMVTISTSDCHNGIYLLRVLSADKQTAFKRVIVLSP